MEVDVKTDTRWIHTSQPRIIETELVAGINIALVGSKVAYAENEAEFNGKTAVVEGRNLAACLAASTRPVYRPSAPVNGELERSFSTTPPSHHITYCSPNALRR